MNMNDDDLFAQAMADITPFPTKTASQNVIDSQQFKLTTAMQAKKAAADEDELLQALTINPAMITPIKPEQVLEYKVDGVQGAVFQQLRKGLYATKIVLELQALTLKQARQILIDEIPRCQYLGERNLIIIHGKGRNNKPFAALIKSAVAQWLTQLEQVQAFHSATKEYGGEGALFVMLKKSTQSKIDNSERNRKGHSKAQHNANRSR
ncbi:DNA endonuclease SmrA [Shewanella intestini]|uniref:DNA endonuclease SmrA n=1 Tax=Shewanella intestini TaxID=2017544 RepID=A0ABS5HZQ2_9GAMM|nr:MULTISPECIES: DNA endonuclease SmrA [Shewanella]MBR9727262.1 DNA endonuclease SmrA [Shewanella intestini]MRG36064.1 DNA endonuclease SmrA [Shewanella sp. XMDDZSB0408]